jgi:serine/threonine-protein kinase RsbW
MEPLTVPGSLDSLEAIGEYVRSVAAAAQLDRREAYKLRLAIDEIATNIVLYGYERAGITGRIELRASITPGALTIVIEDTAPPFDPTAQQAPEDLGAPLNQRKIGGLGIFLALKAVDRFTHAYSGGRNRNTLVVERARQTDERPAREGSPSEV